MLFSSSVFLFFFLPISLLGYQILSRFGRGAILSWLSLVSLFFYGYWNPAYLLLLGASILFNHGAARLITAASANEPRQSRILTAAITGNLLLLMYFKYLFPLLNFFHAHGALPHVYANLILPLGISFFTFTEIAFLIDLKQGLATPQSLLSFTLFVTFFPHLIAGPIIHPREMMPQFASDRLGGGLKREDLTVGLTWFIFGLGKKVLLADPISPVVNAVFAHPTGFGIAGAWIGVVGYAMQLYFDFSGYSDMAVGIARMFSIEFPMNFNSPYKSTSIVDFWTCWHMTLSRYLTEYLYTPISHRIRVRRADAGLRSNRAALATPSGFAQLVAAPTLATMFLAGVWHGAGLQYIVYGTLHGVYITLYHLWRTFVPAQSPMQKLLPRPVTVLLTFLGTVVAFIFFRARGMADAFFLIASMLGLHGRGPAFTGNPNLAEISGPSHLLARAVPATAVLAVFLAIVWLAPNTQQILDQLPRAEAPETLHGVSRRFLWRPSLAWGLAVALILALSILMTDANSTFLYFQF